MLVQSYLVNTSGTSNKFYELTLNGKFLRLRHGKRHSQGTIIRKALASPEAARHQFDKIKAQKLRAGYRAPGLGDYLKRFDAMVKVLEAHPRIVVTHYLRFAPATAVVLKAVEEKLGAPLDAFIKDFFRKTNGIQLRWVYRGSFAYDKKRDEKKYTRRFNYDWADDSDGCVSIPPIQDIFLGKELQGNSHDFDVGDILGEKLTDNEMHRRIKTLDHYYAYYPVAFFTQPGNGNPVVTEGEDYGVLYGPVYCDFRTYMEFLIRSFCVNRARHQFFTSSRTSGLGDFVHVDFARAWSPPNLDDPDSMEIEMEEELDTRGEISEIIERLGDKDYGTALDAAHVLRKRAQDKTVARDLLSRIPEIIDASLKRGEINLEIEFLVWDMPAKAVQPSLLSLLEHQNRQARHFALKLLDHHFGKKASKGVRPLLTDKNLELRAYAALIIGEGKPAGALPHVKDLLAWLRREKYAPELDSRLLTLLARMDFSRSAVREDVLKALLGFVGTNFGEEISEPTTDAIAGLGTFALPKVLKTLTSRDESKREDALLIIRKMIRRGLKPGALPWEKLLRERQDSMRVLAVETLLDLKYTKPLEAALPELLGDSYFMIREYMSALIKKKPASERKVLIAKVISRSASLKPETRTRLLMTLAADYVDIRKQYVGEFLEGLKHKDYEIRRDCMTILLKGPLPRSEDYSALIEVLKVESAGAIRIVGYLHKHKVPPELWVSASYQLFETDLWSFENDVKPVLRPMRGLLDPEQILEGLRRKPTDGKNPGVLNLCSMYPRILPQVTKELMDVMEGTGSDLRLKAVRLLGKQGKHKTALRRMLKDDDERVVRAARKALEPS